MLKALAHKRAGVLAALVAAVAIALPGVELASVTASGAQGADWTTTVSAGPSGVSDPELNGVSCVAAGQCQAVGEGYTTVGVPVSDTLGGGSWTPTSPALESDSVVLNADSCVTANWCMSVGYEQDSNDAWHLIAAVQDDGNWTVNAALERTAYAYPGSAELEGVSCTSETFCVAVGYEDSSAYSYYDLAVVEVFNGTSWSPVSLTGGDLTEGDAELSAVSCADASDCVAVGSFYDESLIATDTDGTWTVTDEFDNAEYESESGMTGVSCPVAGQCEVVGWYEDPYYGDIWALAGSLDDGSWSPDYWDATPAAYDYTFAELSSVSCTAVGACVAGGTVVDEGEYGLVETFSDGTWTPAIIQAPGDQWTWITSVSCSLDAACQAVGTGDNDYGSQMVTVSGALPPTFSGPTSATFTQGTPGSVTLSATGVGPVTMSESGALPPNVTFVDSDTGTGSDTAVLSGTPGPFTGTYTFTVTATDGLGDSTSEEFVLTVLNLGPNPPVVTSISPDVTGAGGGTKVTITGKYFTNVVAVLFDGAPAKSYTVTKSTSISAVAPPNPNPGDVDSRDLSRSGLGPLDDESAENLQVVTAEGASAENLSTEFFYAPPEAAWVTPGSGVSGETVTIDGSFLTGVTSVTFDGTPALSFKMNAAGTAITAVTPYGLSGSAWVEVTSSTGDSYTANDFVFDGPSVTSVSPSKGGYDAENTVTITGNDFVYVYAVEFGQFSSPSFTVNPDGTAITAEVPDGLTGKVNVTVDADAGTSPVVSGDTYVVSAPQITAILPPSAAVGSLITVAGSGLSDASIVWFGSIELAHMYYNTPTSLVVQVPPDPTAGVVNIRVVNPAGESAVTKYDQYEY